MPATIIAEDGTGKADANSYVSQVEADAHFLTTLRAAAWALLSVEDKAVLLISATRVIDVSCQFNGFVAKSLQALQWPRFDAKNPDEYQGALAGESLLGNGFFDFEKVPAGIKLASLEMAGVLLDGKTDSDDRTADAPGTGIEEVEIFQGIRVKFSKADKRPIVPDFIANILSKFGHMLGQKLNNVRVIRA